MKLYLISQEVNNGYDTYDSAVVAAENEQAAKETSPSDVYVWHDNSWYFQYADGTEKSEDSVYSWADRLEDIDAEYIGEAAEGTEAGVICASFNAG